MSVFAISVLGTIDEGLVDVDIDMPSDFFRGAVTSGTRRSRAECFFSENKHLAGPSLD